MPSLNELQTGLRNLLDYTRELLTLNEKVIYDLGELPYPVFYEHQIATLTQIEVNVDGDIWLRVPRIREVAPPGPDKMFDGWVEKQPHASPDAPPKLIEFRMFRMKIDEISDLVEAGRLDKDDVMRPRGAEETVLDEMDAILRIEFLPELQDTWQAYIDGAWKHWAEAERPRRRVIEIYNRLFQIQQAMIAGGADTPMELVFGLGMARWRIKREEAISSISVPLVEQLVEVELLEGGNIEVRPRGLPAQLNLKPFLALELEGAKSLQRDGKDLLDQIAHDPTIGFSPFEPQSFERLLRMCQARLTSSARYAPDDREDPADRGLPALDEKLVITDTWVIFVRQRSMNFRVADIDALKRQINKADDESHLPPPSRRFVRPPSTEPAADFDGPTVVLPGAPDGWSGPRGSGANGNSQDGLQDQKRSPELYFPLPYNDEQMEIIRRLESADGVVVQGPPGTGKTHTIANIICHYMATHRRVLVTARTPEALTALHEKIPENIRKLAISVIHNDREGASQLEQAVNLLANEAKNINPHEVKAQVIEKERRLASAKQRMAEIDKRLFAIAKKNLDQVPYRDRTLLPMELAKLVLAERKQHEWFPDKLNIGDRFTPQFTDQDIGELRAIRERLSADIVYEADGFPNPSVLPNTGQVLAAHAQHLREREIELRIRAGELPIVVIERSDAIQRARELKTWLESFNAHFTEAAQHPWVLALYQTLVGARNLDATSRKLVSQLVAEWVTLYDRGRILDANAIDLGNVEPIDEEFTQAVEILAIGRKPFGLLAFGKKRLKKLLTRVKIAAQPATTLRDWQTVLDLRIWQRETVSFLSRWVAATRTGGHIELPDILTDGLISVIRHGRFVAACHNFAAEAEQRILDVQAFFPVGVNARAAILGGTLGQILDALAANIERGEMDDARALKDLLLSFAGERRLPFEVAVGEIADALGNSAINQQNLAELWRGVENEAKRLHKLRGDRERLEALVGRVSASGAPLWAKYLATKPVDFAQDLLTPPHWIEAWQWARADGFIRDLSDRETLHQLGNERADIEADERSLLAEIIRLNTFLGLKRRMSDAVLAALAKFALAIRRLGRGTGMSASRHRRSIREATLEAAIAVPCWILPEWRVSEQLPAELGAFDLVIVDEASQSDITALPAVFRGKKLLIVGDDKQVSPTPIGLPDRTIIQLRNTYLSGLPYADQMEPAVSLYDLGSIIFPGETILLREHFRCVEPIIHFSSRFYSSPLIPLRVPKPSERLDPPLIDIYVPHGEKRGDVNPAEIEVIVEEIKELVADPKFTRRTIGVISLIGSEQAKIIYERLVGELGAEVVEHHGIMCGNAATFQGQERDIVFLSMVAAPNDVRKQAATTFAQRFNVAMSRARDRLVLVRSVSTMDLRPGDLKLEIIQHFENPMAGGPPRASGIEILELCDSGFEREVGRRLLDRGYRIRAQMPAGGSRIDFVVEGTHDRRLAVELDGDNFHGPDQWAKDIRRQKKLEQLGWKFWRCWGSNWAADSDGCFDDLVRTLTRQGIEPIGMARTDETFTEHRRAKSPVAEVVVERSFGATEGPGLFEQRTTTSPSQEVVKPIPVSGEQLLMKDLGELQGGRDIPKPVVPDRLPEPRAGEAISTDHALSFDREPGQVAPASSMRAVQSGDTVTFRYTDQPNRTIRVQLSATNHEPENGVINVGQPLAKALIGNAIEDEIEIAIAGHTRSLVIERIEREQALA